MPSKPTPQTWETAKQAIKSYQQEVLRPNLRQYTLLHNKAPEPDYLAYVRQAIDELIPLFARMGRAVQAIRPAITVKQREKLRKLITACGPRFSVYDPARAIVDGKAITELENYVADLSIDLTKATRESGPKGKGKRDQWIGRAAIELKKNSLRTDSEIAKEIGISPSTLSRSEAYQRIATEERRKRINLPKGYIVRNEDGQTRVEAVAPPSKYEQVKCRECGESIRILPGTDPICDKCREN